MKLIYAETLKAHYAWWADENKKLFDEIVDAQPEVDAVPIVHGRWIKPTWNPPDEYESDYTCSNCGWSGTVCVCGKEQIGRGRVNFCPICGAKMMDGGENDETN